MLLFWLFFYVFFVFFFFFFKQKTAYEMRISDWSRRVLFRSPPISGSRSTTTRKASGSASWRRRPSPSGRSSATRAAPPLHRRGSDMHGKPLHEAPQTAVSSRSNTAATIRACDNEHFLHPWEDRKSTRLNSSH